MRLLEVIRGDKTAPEVLATGLDVAKRLRKLPVITANAFGFVGNRIYSTYWRQCEFMLEEGALPQQADALEAFGFAMGPFAVADMSGLDIAWRTRQRQAATRDPGARAGSPCRRMSSGRRGTAAPKHQLWDPEVEGKLSGRGPERRFLSLGEVFRSPLGMSQVANPLILRAISLNRGGLPVALKDMKAGSGGSGLSRGRGMGALLLAIRRLSS